MTPPPGVLQQMLQSTLQQLPAAEAGGVSSTEAAPMQRKNRAVSTTHLIILFISFTSWAPSLPREPTKSWGSRSRSPFGAAPRALTHDQYGE